MFGGILFTSNAYSQQNKVYTFKIKDAAGFNMSGVSLKVVGTSNGTYTNWDGYAVLNIPIFPNIKTEVKITYIGFKEKIIPITGSIGTTHFTITMEYDSVETSWVDPSRSAEPIIFPMNA